MSANLFYLRAFRLVTSPMKAYGERSEAVDQRDPHTNVVRFLRDIKLKRAKHYLQRHGIKQWDRWDRTNTAFAWRRNSKPQP